MNHIIRLIKLNLIQLRRRICFLIALSAVFGLLGFLLAQGVSDNLEREEILTVLNIGLVGSEKDINEIIKYADALEGLNEYCQFIYYSYEDASSALERKELVAFVELPDDFLLSITNGENDSATLHLNSTQAGESMITLYFTQRATDLLATAQGAVYAILDTLREQNIYREHPIFESNVHFITFLLTRDVMYETEVIHATDAVPLELHYLQTLIGFILFMSGVIFYPILSKNESQWRLRLKTIGITPILWEIGVLSTLFLCFFPLLLATLLICGTFSIGGLLSLLIFIPGFLYITSTYSTSESMTSCCSFLLIGVMIFLAGGIIPPVLMPSVLKSLMPYNPFTYVYQSMNGTFSFILIILGISFIIFPFLYKIRKEG